MVSARTATAALGLLASLAVSGVAWLHFGTPVLFLLIPFVPLLFGRRRERPPVRECPVCGFRTRDREYDYCPRDGTELE